MILLRNHQPASAHTNCLIVLLNSSEPLQDSDLEKLSPLSEDEHFTHLLALCNLYFRCVANLF
jgi:hypothetical protein